MNARAIYESSNGEETKAMYAALERRGAIGVIAVNLFRAQKCSARAKVYRGGIRGLGSYRRMAYDRKNWALDNLAAALEAHAGSLGIRWGWKEDPATPGFEHALYIDLPAGQVSFHSASRRRGPDYAGDWDGQKQSAERIIAFCDELLAAPPDPLGGHPSISSAVTEVRHPTSDVRPPSSASRENSRSTAALRATVCAACGESKPSGCAFCRACFVRLWSIGAARALPEGLPLRIYATPAQGVKLGVNRDSFEADYVAALAYLKNSGQCPVTSGEQQHQLFGGAQ